MDIDANFWLEFARTAATVAALMISVASFAVAMRAQRIALRQEERRKPLLVPYLAKAFIRHLPGCGRAYAFLISVSNPTDTNNSMARVDLVITYRKDSHQVSLKVSLNTEAKQNFTESESSTFAIPASIDAHKAVAGWFYFYVNGFILGENIVEDHRIVITDTHGAIVTLEPIVIPEYQDETQKKAPNFGSH